jgi:RNA polymerase sigma factor (sigma-70 family)
MASGALGGTLRHFRDLFGDGTAVGLGDAQLLARYAASRDEAAFAALVARHGPMVLATCRAILKHEHDVEDAFQATFLVLARKAGSVRAGDALGGWLHRVAYRASVDASADSRRRRRREAEAAARAALEAATDPDPEVAAVVHEELDRLPDRHRLPVVLCDLEGLTYEQAAARLRWSEPTLRHRLVKARGRLRERLTRRGITAGALAAFLTAQATGAKAAVPAALARAAVATAAGGTASATAAALSAAIIRSMTMTKLKIASAGVLGAMALASAGVVAVGAGRTGEPRAAIQAPGPAKGQAAAQPTSASSGPGIEGRIVDLEGRPVAGARIKVPGLWSAPDNDLGRWLERARDAGVNGPWEGLTWSGVNLTATTDAEGRFRLAGVGPEQLAEVLVSGPTIATARLYVAGRHEAEVRAMNHQGRTPTPIVFHARRFDLAVAPGKPIEGVIRDKDTGRPIAGLTLRAAAFEEDSFVPAPGIETTTDARGSYRLAGLPKAPAYRVFVEPGQGQPYPHATLRVAGDTPAFQPVTFDFALKRGILVRGKVTDKATGQPVSGGFVNAYAFVDNPHVEEFPGFKTSLESYSPILPKDGRYEVIALPGRGLIAARADNDKMERYRGYVGAEAIKGYDPRDMGFRTRPGYCDVRNYNVVAEIDLDPKAETATVDLQLDPGRTIAVTPIDPEGRPVAGTVATGVGDLFPGIEYPQASPTIEIHGLDPSRPRRVTVTHGGRKLIGSIELKGDEASPVTIRLQPYGTITGRIVDEDGR